MNLHIIGFALSCVVVIVSIIYIFVGIIEFNSKETVFIGTVIAFIGIVFAFAIYHGDKSNKCVTIYTDTIIIEGVEYVNRSSGVKYCVE